MAYIIFKTLLVLMLLFNLSIENDLESNVFEKISILNTNNINDKFIYQPIDYNSIFPSNNHKYLMPIVIDGNQKNIENSIFKPKISTDNIHIFRESVKNIKLKSKKSDIIFLIDSSSSVGKTNFYSEIRFVNKLLKHFDLSYNYSRIALITFSSQGKVIRHIDQISDPSDKHDQCSAITNDIPKLKFVGGGTFTYGALKEAREIFSEARNNSKKYIFLISDGFSNGRNPLSMAEKLKSEDNVTIFTIGIQSGNSAELLNISSLPKEKHSFLLDSFLEFERLVRNALRKDHKLSYKIQLNDEDRCNVLCENFEDFNSTSGQKCCNSIATCECGIPSGFYSCICPAGYIGSGILDDCSACIANTYWVSSDLCHPCPDINHITKEYPATKPEHCICKTGFKSTGDNRCEGITCTTLPPPENGYFVKQVKTCVNVLNAACGARCKSGYQLKGTSLRLCQENGTWSGTEAQCILKTCPSLVVPYYGMITCKNRDLNLTSYEYSPRNQTFMLTYDDDNKRITEPMPIDTECSYKCGPGYYLVGSKTRNCLPLSKWDGLQTTCKQVLCSPLPKSNYGFYDSSECSEIKVPFNTNCSLLCPSGFQLQGPSVKNCQGKKIGIWSDRNKIPKCIDNIAPEIKCPESFKLNVGPTHDTILIKSFPPPLHISDTSGLNVTYWLTPTIDENTGTHLKIKDHIFTYVATDTFNNQAECTFMVSVVDTTPPIYENCIDPSEFFISPSLKEPGDFIEWDEPTFYDNSNGDITVIRSIDPGFLTPGKYRIVYEATDPSGNMNTCTLNITVKEYYCEKLESPLNGQSICAKNLTHTWCAINCNTGYTILHPASDEYVDSFRMTCENNNPKWEIDSIPDCTLTELPNSIEELLTISIDSDESFCSNELKQNELTQNLSNNIKKFLCDDISNCDIISEIPECLESDEEPSNDIMDKTFYRTISKRQTNNTSPRKVRSKLRIRLYTRIGKKLGIWKKNHTLSENVRQVKYILKDININDSIKRVLDELNIDVKKLKIDELIRCPDGSVAKKYLCYQCPRGTYQDAAYNRCMLCPIGSYNNELGKAICKNCPVNYSTRKMGRIKPVECKQLCPPGTAAKIRIQRRRTPIGYSNSRSMMPFCRKCNPGDYQPNYDQIDCLHCKYGYDSNRGSKSENDCIQRELHPCQKNLTICGENGFCIPENGGSDLYSCLCLNGFIGSHCEYQVNLCLSAPCQNNGHCYYMNRTAIACQCLPQYRGIICEELKYSCSNTICQNGGTCSETDDDIHCECLPGYDGKFCEKEIYINFCSFLPCESGNCQNIPSGYICQCPPGIIGKRCHLKPCDHFPCHDNAICIDLLHYPATTESFICKCPQGLKGYDCSQVHNPCDAQPCKNNGKCIPQASRQIGKFAEQPDTYGLDDKKYGQYVCKCPPYFYGDHCEIFTTPDFLMHFPRIGNTMNYVELKGPERNLNELSFCVWIRTNDTFNYGSIISYATDDNDNVFTFTDYTGFVFYVNGQNIVTDIVVNDGEWHFICAAWTNVNGFYEIYMDGILQNSGFNLSQQISIPANGIFIIGQEQDMKGGGFSETESFIGDIAYFDIWEEFIYGHQVQEYYNTCEPYQGSLYSWTDFKIQIHGDIKVHRSEFCHECSKNLTFSNGYVNYINNNQANYRCNIGFILKGHNLRNCLKTSQWSLNIPYCSIVECELLSRLENGNIEYTGTVYRSYAEYSCDHGFYLVGNRKRTCLASGNWSGFEPNCISKIKCKALNLPNNIKINYSDNNGILNRTFDEYQMGTFAEISCGFNVVDSILTCLEDGEWDGFIPENCYFHLDAITTKKSITTHSQLRSTVEPLNTIVSSNYNIHSIYEPIDISTEKINLLKLSSTTNNPAEAETTFRPTEFGTRQSKNLIINQEKAISTSTTTAQPTTTPKTLNFKTNPSIITFTTTQLPLTKFILSTKPTTIQTSTTKPISNSESTIMETTKPHSTTITPTTTMKSTVLQILTTKLSATEKTNLFTENLTTTTAEFSISNLDFRKSVPDKIFWTNLKNYLFYGCNSKASSLLILCSKQQKYIQLNDLTDFMPPDSSEYHGIDVKLLKFLKMNTKFITKLPKLNYENFFNMILYGNLNINSNKLSEIMEDSLRFALCIYIDTIIWNNTVRESAEDDSSVENITDKLKWLIYKNAIPVFNDYKNRMKIEEIIEFTTTELPTRTRRWYNNNEFSTSALEEEISDSDNDELECLFDNIKKIPENGYISEQVDKQVITRDFFGKGEKLYLICNHGYRSHGKREFYCQTNGEWSKILARCSRLSCEKPKLKNSTKIVRGRSFLYNDEILVKCEDESTVKIICESNGKWHPNEIC